MVSNHAVVKYLAQKPSSNSHLALLLEEASVSPALEKATKPCPKLR
jgi:hypothetical protein